MSTENGTDDSLRQPGRVEQSFFSRNSWLKPFVLLEFALLAMLVLLDLANDLFPVLRGRFSSVIFGTILAIIVLSLLTAAIVLCVNVFRQLAE